MGSKISFYCGNSDTKQLSDYAESLGLVLVAPIIDQLITDKISAGPFCYISTVPGSELTHNGNPPTRLSDATDPLISYLRSYFKDPYLILGHLSLSNDVPELYKKTKPVYKKLCKWIQSNWSRQGGFYIGEEASALIDSGAQKVNMLPGTFTFQQLNL